MSKIRILPENLCNKIAAGEIVDRPASVVKELVENAIDAGGTRIFIDVRESGRRWVRVSDNGEGMGPEDAREAFERHATSKLRDEADLSSIRTMGFRGEALPSIGAVSRVRLVSALKGARSGTEVRLNGGKLSRTREAAAAQGTSVEVEDLFYNTPARRKFLKSNSTELSHILRTVQQQALPHPWIHFRLTHNDHILLDFPIVRDEIERARQIIGPEESSELIEVQDASDAIQLKGLVSRAGHHRATRERQEFFLNRRAIKNASLSHAVGEAYGTLLARGRHPSVYLFVEMDPSRVDVNVHPAKREVRFCDTQAIHQFVRNSLRERVIKEGLPRPPVLETDRPIPYQNRKESVDPGRAPGSGRSPEQWPQGQIREAMSIYRPLENSHPSSVEPAQTAATSTGRLPVDIRPLGQVDQTYIVAVVQSDSGPELHLLDQHAAHERLLFERLQSQRRADRIAVQPLLIPEVVEMQAGEAIRLREILPLLKRIGLEVEEFGDRSFRIHAAPALLGPVDGRLMLEDILDEVSEGGMPDSEAAVQSILASMACQAAIKAHQSLQPEQMEQLLKDLYRQEVPPTCPHGRPIRVRFGLEDLEKMFQRR